jgi:hypothetical protein
MEGIIPREKVGNNVRSATIEREQTPRDPGVLRSAMYSIIQTTQHLIEDDERSVGLIPHGANTTELSFCVELDNNANTCCEGKDEITWIHTEGPNHHCSKSIGQPKIR